MQNSEWKGRYGPLILLLAQHANQSVRSMSDKKKTEPAVFSCYQEWLVFEYIVEHPEGIDSMRAIADGLCISKSSVTKYTHNLCSLGYIRRYQTEGNRKNIILRVTDSGMSVYRSSVEHVMKPLFAPFFAELDAIPQEYLDIFVEAFGHHNQRRYPLTEEKLIPLDDE